MQVSGASTSAETPHAEAFIYAPSARALGVLACGLREQAGPTGEIELHPTPRGKLHAFVFAVLVSGLGFGVALAFSSAGSHRTLVFWTISLTATTAGIFGGLVTMGLSRQYTPYEPLLAWNPRTAELTLDGGKITLTRDEIQHLSFENRRIPHFNGAEGYVIVDALVVATTDGRRILALPLPLFSRAGATVKAVMARIQAR